MVRTIDRDCSNGGWIALGKAVASAYRAQYGLEVTIPTIPEPHGSGTYPTYAYPRKAHGLVTDTIRTFMYNTLFPPYPDCS